MWSLFLIILAVQATFLVDLQNQTFSGKNITSLDVVFSSPVNVFSISNLALSDGSSLNTATFTMVSTSRYRLSNINLDPDLVTLQIKNPPPSLCTPIPLNTSAATLTVGTGTPSSCTESALNNALNQANSANGGVIKFNCSSNQNQITTIKLTSSLKITAKSSTSYTTIDGNGLIELDGQSKVQILNITGPDWRYGNPVVTIQGVRFVNGYSTDAENTKQTNKGGAAIYVTGGILTLINCDFYNNQAPLTGQDVAGGAVFHTGAQPTYVSGCMFWNNQASNGGAMGNLGPSVTLINTYAAANSATGYGANPGNGGNGGAFSFDGQGNNVSFCGAIVQNNQFHALGGGFFRVGYNVALAPGNDWVFIDKSSFSYNFNPLSDTGAAGGFYIQDLNFQMKSTSIAYNKAKGNAGAQIGPNTHLNWSHVSFVNNTCSYGNSLGAAFSSSTGVSGTITYSTFAFNYGFFGTINGPTNTTYLSNSIISNNYENNGGYSPLSCSNGKFNSAASNQGIYQWPLILPHSGNSEATKNNCTVTNVQLYVDPQLNPVADNGCVGPTVTIKNGSPAAGVGAACPGVNSFQPLTVFVSSSRPVDRLSFLNLRGLSAAFLLLPSVSTLLCFFFSIFLVW